jgi:hypothetical protein
MEDDSTTFPPLFPLPPLGGRVGVLYRCSQRTLYEYGSWDVLHLFGDKDLR